MRTGSIATISLEVMIPRRLPFSITGRCFMLLLPIIWMASWRSLSGPTDVRFVDMIMLIGVVLALSPLATAFLAISCSVIIPIAYVPSMITRELISL